MERVGVYPYSYETAKHNGKYDEELYKLSYKQNVSCFAAIKKAIADNFDGMHLNADTAKQVIDEFGYDRVNWVLANTVQKLDYDGRFSHDNKDWAKGFYIPKDMIHHDDRNRDYVVDSHPAVLDGFINQARRAYKELNLWDISHCNEKDDLDFTNKVMILRPTILKDEYKTPDNQLFYCNGGFGCSPTASGRKVYGEFLIDGEEMNYQRTDFVGELKPEYLPDWAKEKLSQKQKPSIKKQLVDTPKQEHTPKQPDKDKGAR